MTQAPPAGRGCRLVPAYTPGQLGGWAVLYSRIMSRRTCRIRHGMVAEATVGSQQRGRSSAMPTPSRRIRAQNQAFPLAYAEEVIRDEAARRVARLANQTSA